MGVSALVSMAVITAASTGYSVSSSQSALHKSHGEANKLDAQQAQLMKTLTPEEEQKKSAGVAAEQRRRQYANVGRSSTILTQGLGSSPADTSNAPKVLLGL